jgi:arsenite methyltransferase
MRSFIGSSTAIRRLATAGWPWSKIEPVTELHHPEARLRVEFDRWAREGRGEAMEEGHSAIADAVITRMPIQPESVLLDLSCGSGWATRRLARRAHHGKVWGVDLSSAMIERARHAPDNPPNVDYDIAPASALPFGDETFDAILSIEAFYYFPDVAGVLAECLRTLKHSGELDILINLFWENELSRRWPDLLNVPVHVLKAADWVKLAKAVGFSAVYEERIPDSTPVPADYPGGRWFQNAEELTRFRQQGALRVVAIR